MRNIDSICYGSQTTVQSVGRKSEWKPNGAQKEIVGIRSISLRCETVTYELERFFFHFEIITNI